MKSTFLLSFLAMLALPLPGRGELLRHARDLVAALRGKGPSDVVFDITATVTYVSTNNFNANANIAGFDDTGAVLFRREDVRLVPSLPARGSRARFRGSIAADSYGRRFAVLAGCENTIPGSPVQPSNLSYAELMDRRNDYRLCRFSGTLLDAACQITSRCWIMLTVGDRENHVYATVPSFSPDELDRLETYIGSPVTVTGICVPYDHSPRLQVGRLFKIATPADIEFGTPGTSRETNVPSIDELTVSRPADLVRLGRHRAVGDVVAVWLDGNALLRTDRGDFVGLAFTRDQPLPRYGERIEATGLPETDLFKVNLVNVGWRRLSDTIRSPDVPTPLSMSQLLVTVSGNRRRLYCGDYLGKPIQLRGIVRGCPDSSNQFLYVECEGFLVTVDASATPAALAGVSVDCTVDVSGTCVLDIETPSARSTIPRLKGFALVVRTPADVTVVARPPWWTPDRLSAVIATLLAVLLGIFAWNRSLRRKVERKGRELAEETVNRDTANLKVYERTRLAVELHDTLAQNLTGISMEIDAAKRFAKEDSMQMSHHLNVASRSLKSCRDDLRNCIWDLRHQTLENGDMAEAIRLTLAPHVEGIDLSVRFSVPRERISDNTAHAILRIVRELTVNAIRHGSATSVKVAGSIEGDKLLFSVRDNGCGFDPTTCPGIEQGHYGLQGIHERIDAFEGELRIDSHSGNGTKVTIALNIPKERQT